MRVKYWFVAKAGTEERQEENGQEEKGQEEKGQITKVVRWGWSPAFVILNEFGEDWRCQKVSMMSELETEDIWRWEVTNACSAECHWIAFQPCTFGNVSDDLCYWKQRADHKKSQTAYGIGNCLWCESRGGNVAHIELQSNVLTFSPGHVLSSHTARDCSSCSFTSVILCVRPGNYLIFTAISTQAFGSIAWQVNDSDVICLQARGSIWRATTLAGTGKSPQSGTQRGK